MRRFKYDGPLTLRVVVACFKEWCRKAHPFETDDGCYNVGVSRDEVYELMKDLGERRMWDDMPRPSDDQSPVMTINGCKLYLDGIKD
mgnify:CR=1 FL=1